MLGGEVGVDGEESVELDVLGAGRHGESVGPLGLALLGVARERALLREERLVALLENARERERETKMDTQRDPLETKTKTHHDQRGQFRIFDRRLSFREVKHTR